MTWQISDLPPTHPLRQQAEAERQEQETSVAMPIIELSRLLEREEPIPTGPYDIVPQHMRREMREMGMWDDMSWARLRKIMTRGVVPE